MVVVKNSRRFNVVCCGRRWGKTTLGLDRLVMRALPGYPVAWFSPTYKMLADVWRMAVRVLRPLTRALSVQEKRIELVTGGVLDFWSLDSPDAARGRKYREVVVDEAARIPNFQEAWTFVIRPTLADFAGGAWFFSTPNGADYFKRLFDKGQDEKEKDWYSVQMPTITNPYIDPKEIEAAQHDLPERAFAQEYGADFVASEAAFIPPEWWDVGCYNRHLSPLDGDQATVVALDAGVSNDCFAMVMVSKRTYARTIAVDPAVYIKDPGLAAYLHLAGADIVYDYKVQVRFARVWTPPPGGQIDFEGPEIQLRQLVDTNNVVRVAYDPYQLHSFATRLRNEGIRGFREFTQNSLRTEADKMLFDNIRDGRIEHDHSWPVLSQHILNANAKIEDTNKLRLVKRNDDLKIDACVALSMANYEASRLNI